MFILYTGQTCFTSTAYQRNISHSSVGLILTCASTWPIKTAYCCVCLCALTRQFPSDLLGQTLMSFLSHNDRNSGPLLVLLPQINDRRKLEKDQLGALVWNVYFNHILSPSQLSSLSWAATTLSCIMTSGITMCSASAAVYHRVRPRCSFAKTWCSCSHSLFAGYIIHHGSATETHVFHSTSVDVSRPWTEHPK